MKTDLKFIKMVYQKLQITLILDEPSQWRKAQ